MSNWLRAVARIIRATPEPTKWLWTDRQEAYALFDAFYANTVYDTLFNGGQRENINSALGNAAAADLAGIYNPVQNVVDLYLHVFGGAFGDEIQAVTQNAALLPALEKIWQWSNLTIEKQPLCRMAANHGLVGLRIVARNDPDPAKRRVWLKPEHPRVIRDVELDERGNVEAVQLEYEITTGLAEDAQTICIREELTKDAFRAWRVIGGSLVPFDLFDLTDNGARAVVPNALGVVPYVLLRHSNTGDAWGRNAYYQAIPALNRLNALVSHIGIQIHQHVRATWMVAAAGDPPAEFDFADKKIIYVNTRNSAGTPMMQPLVANLDLSGAIQQAKLQIDLIEDMLPELKATAGKFLAGQSGQTIAELRKPAEDRLRMARDTYEDALVRGQQIAASWGVLLGLWDLGTGMGTREAADRAFQSGLEDHQFNKRPLLTEAVGAAPLGASADPQPGAQAVDTGTGGAMNAQPQPAPALPAAAY